MRQLELLWTYQQADQEVDKYEAELLKDPTRQRLLKLRNFIVEQQSALAQLEEDAQKALARINELGDIDKTVRDELEQGVGVMEEAEFETSEEVREALDKVLSLQHQLTRSERELSALINDAGAFDDRLKSIRQRAQKGKTDYDTLKAAYDESANDRSEKLKELKARRDEAASGIQPDILERYKTVKQRRVPAMAMLNGDQCAGCYMSLPSVVVKALNAGNRVVECENCGRILYVG